MICTIAQVAIVMSNSTRSVESGSMQIFLYQQPLLCEDDDDNGDYTYHPDDDVKCENGSEQRV